MKVILEPLPPLSGELKVKSIELRNKSLKTSQILVSLYKMLKGKIPLDESGTPKPGYILLLDGVDVRILLEEDVEFSKDQVKLTIIPVNHGG